MAPQHATCGLLAGVGVAAFIPAAPWPIRVLVVIVTGGAALLPDLDHPQATAAKSLGPVTKVIAIGVDRTSVAVYHATRAAGDPRDRHGGHRLLTHTVPWCLVVGVLVGLLGVVSPIGLAVSCGLLAGLLALGFKQAGFGLAVATGGVSWWLLDHDPSWSWVVPVAVTAGCLVHLAGDAVTPSGVPILWPLKVGGQRWRMVSTPVTFDAGGTEETMLVAPLLVLGLLVAVAQVTGVLPVVLAAVARAVA